MVSNNVLEAVELTEHCISVAFNCKGAFPEGLEEQLNDLIGYFDIDERADYTLSIVAELEQTTIEDILDNPEYVGRTKIEIACIIEGQFKYIFEEFKNATRELDTVLEKSKATRKSAEKTMKEAREFLKTIEDTPSP